MEVDTPPTYQPAPKTVERGAPSGQDLLQAIRDGRERLAIELVQKGADPNSKDSYEPAITQAIRAGYEKLAIELVQRGADLNSRDSYGPAITQAKFARFEELEKELLKHGTIASPSGSTQLTYGGTSGRTVRSENITSNRQAPSTYRRNAIQILGTMTEEELLRQFDYQMNLRQTCEDANNDEDLRKLSATTPTAKNSGSIDNLEQKRVSIGSRSDDLVGTDPVRIENIQAGPGGVHINVSTPTSRIERSFQNSAEFVNYLATKQAEQNFEAKYGAG